MTDLPNIDTSMAAVATNQLAAIDQLAARAEGYIDHTSDDDLWRFALNARVTAANLALAIDHHEPIPARQHTETMRALQVMQEGERLDRARAERHTAEQVDAEVARTVRARMGMFPHTGGPLG